MIQVANNISKRNRTVPVILVFNCFRSPLHEPELKIQHALCYFSIWFLNNSYIHTGLRVGKLRGNESPIVILPPQHRISASKCTKAGKIKQAGMIRFRHLFASPWGWWSLDWTGQIKVNTETAVFAAQGIRESLTRDNFDCPDIYGGILNRWSLPRPPNRVRLGIEDDAPEIERLRRRKQ